MKAGRKRASSRERKGGGSSVLARGRPGFGILIGLSLVLILGACATKGDVRELREDMRALADRQERLLNELERLHWVTQDSIRQQSRMLTGIRGEMNQRILDVQDQVIELQALTGQSQQVLAGLRDQLEDQRRQAAQPAPGTGGQPWWMWDAEDADPGDAEGARELFNAAVTQFNRGSLGTARRAFEDFRERFPDHQLTPDVRYFLAEIQAQEGDREEAIEGFLRIQELHPTAVRVPDALLRVGELYLEGEEYELAEEYLERVVNTYPDTDAADAAEERLRDLP